MKKAILFLLIVLSCDSKQQSNNYKILNFKSFSIQTPNEWKKIELQGIDSYVGGLVTKNNDTITFDMGYYSNNLEDKMPIIMDSVLWESTSVEMKENYEKEGFVMVKDFQKVDNDIYRTTNIIWDTIDGLKCKIKYPIIFGKGITGVYFDSISQNNYNMNKKLRLSGENLNIEEQNELIKAIRTIKFKN
ncbi:hypothetical protein ACTS91_16500 [Empedobacter falsenii]|uniref:Uncharacterized protein n=1 Tax=Empedobacter falsenii TaxID=343874 RepID=A0A376GA49_9FLAO|nr:MULTISPECIES: hypothetical protein [Empedobacter]MDH1881551.1 hypothetical protein [Empedobacter sp. GD03797]MDM1042689.1 hypothetical protein [Empedobacter brevis]MDM1136548.1 hypothetical protein [Empedobacter sp. R750]STD56123.1 Uncharacterised protein [Empedobacter falsenii]